MDSKKKKILIGGAVTVIGGAALYFLLRPATAHAASSTSPGTFQPLIPANPGAAAAMAPTAAAAPENVPGVNHLTTLAARIKALTPAASAFCKSNPTAPGCNGN